ncbi:MAG: hypothetical protein V3U78_10035, partial [Thiotrichaceae bacterium]
HNSINNCESPFSCYRKLIRIAVNQMVARHSGGGQNLCYRWHYASMMDTGLHRHDIAALI